MFSAFLNSLKIPDLRKRIFFTLAILALCRLAAVIPCPGINPTALEELFESLEKSSGGEAGILGMLGMFTGGALQNFAVAALGIMPYITASIIIQLMTPVFPNLEKLKREGESGYQTLNQYTRYLTLTICIIQGFFLAKGMENPSSILQRSVPDVVLSPGLGFEIMTVIILTCGTMTLMWLGEQISDRGVGNGASLIITIFILDRLPSAVFQLWQLIDIQGSGSGQEYTMIHGLILLALFMLVMAATIALTVAVRKIPIQYARASAGQMGSNAKQASFLPLKVNHASVMPIIFASALMAIPPILISWGYSRFGFIRWISDNGIFNFGSTWYMVIYGVMIIFFTFFYVAQQFNPVQISDNLKSQGAYIPGIRPGKPTSDFLDWSMTRITCIGAIFLTALALLPMLFYRGMNLPFIIASYFGGTSLLIIVGVVLDTIRQIETHLLMHRYEGFLQRGHLRSRGGI